MDGDLSDWASHFSALSHFDFVGGQMLTMAIGNVKIEVSDIEKYSLVIRSANGQVVYLDRNVEEVDVSGLSGGNYLLQLDDEENRILTTRKMVIVK